MRPAGHSLQMMESPHPRICPACGATNLLTAIYCCSCRSILPAVPVLPGVMGRVKSTSPWDRLRAGISGLTGKIPSRIVPLMLLVVTGLALWPASPPAGFLAPCHGVASFPDLKAPEGMRILSDGQATAILLALWQANPMVDGASLSLRSGGIGMVLRLSWHGIPATLSLGAVLKGDAGAWTLEPVSGSVGHLPVGGRAALFLLSRIPGRNVPLAVWIRGLFSSRLLEFQEHSLRF